MKRLTALLLSILMLVSLASCGSKKDVEEETTTVDYNVNPEAFVGEGYRMILSGLVRTNFEIVEKIAVNGRLDSNEKGKVTDKITSDYESLLALYSSVYCAENAEKLLKKSYTQKKDGLYVKGNPKKEGTNYNIGTIEINVSEKTDEQCTFKASVMVTDADGKESTKVLNCKAVYENSTWLLEDMYY